MATIFIEQGKGWTEQLTSLLNAAGHEVVSDGSAEIAVVDIASVGAASSALAEAEPTGDALAVARNLAGKPLADIEKQVILSTLEQFKGHRVRTASALGIGVRTLGMKLKKWRDEGEPIISRSTPARSPVHAG